MFSIGLDEKNDRKTGDYAGFEDSFVFDPQFDIDCVLSVLMEICEILATYSNIIFRCSGFDLKWMLDVETDFSTIVEDLPATIENLRNLENGSIDFFEQQTEREIVFFGFKEEHCFAKCLTTVSNGNSPRKEKIGTVEKLVLVELIAELTVLFGDFIRIACVYCPTRSSNPYFVKWVDSYRHLFTSTETEI